MTVSRCKVDGAPIEYTDTGVGPLLLFVHGVYVTGALWNEVIDELGDQFRCIAPTWPLGAHEAIGGDVDLGAAAAARRIVHFIEILDLHDVTVVSNDTGGGLVLSALGDENLDLSRIARLIFTNCDSYEHFPPGSFARIVWLCRRSPRLGAAVLRALASRQGRSFFIKSVCHTRPSPIRQAQIFGAFATSAATRSEAVQTTATLDPALTLRASAAIERFDKPVTIAWGTNDKLFPLEHGRRLAAAFPHAHMVEISGSSTYVMIDAPRELAAALRTQPTT